jgi:hypothetical protein
MSAPSSPSKPRIDPKELFPVAVGVAIGIAMLVGFWVLMKVLGMATFVEYTNLPRQ